jgi:hypothetical protein
VACRSQAGGDDHQLPEVLVDAIPFEGFDPEDYMLAFALSSKPGRHVTGSPDRLDVQNPS